jgi:hypothetical protein
MNISPGPAGRCTKLAKLGVRAGIFWTFAINLFRLDTMRNPMRAAGILAGRRRPALARAPFRLEAGTFSAFRTLKSARAKVIFASLSGYLAQLVEQLTLNQRVEGSTPSVPTTF